MKTLFAIALAAMICAGCASVSREASKPPPKAPVTAPAASLLDQADARMAAEDYSGASALYGEFAAANPQNAQTARALATRKVLDRMLSSQSELDRLKQSDELPRVRRQLSERQSEADRLRGEVAKLRADLERLRNIDLDNLPGTKK